MTFTATSATVLNSAGTLIERDLSLPGGVSVALPASGSTQSWSYVNLHGDSILMADSAGVRVGTRASYDPFGQPLDPTTGSIGTLTADDSAADTSPGEPTTPGSEGHASSLNTTERSPPSRWGYDSTSQHWVGSCPSTRSRAA